MLQDHTMVPLLRSGCKLHFLPAFCVHFNNHFWSKMENSWNSSTSFCLRSKIGTRKSRTLQPSASSVRNRISALQYHEVLQSSFLDEPLRSVITLPHAAKLCKFSRNIVLVTHQAPLIFRRTNICENECGGSSSVCKRNKEWSVRSMNCLLKNNPLTYLKLTIDQDYNTTFCRLDVHSSWNMLNTPKWKTLNGNLQSMLLYTNAKWRWRTYDEVFIDFGPCFNPVAFKCHNSSFLQQCNSLMNTSEKLLHLILIQLTW